MALENACVEKTTTSEEFGRMSSGAASVRGQCSDALDAPEWPPRWARRGQDEAWTAPGGETLVPLDGEEVRTLCHDPTEAPDWP